MRDKSTYKRPVADNNPIRKFSLPATMILPSVLILSCTSPLKRYWDVYWE